VRDELQSFLQDDIRTMGSKGLRAGLRITAVDARSLSDGCSLVATVSSTGSGACSELIACSAGVGAVSHGAYEWHIKRFAGELAIYGNQALHRTHAVSN